MAPSKDYMLSRALRQLEAVLSDKDATGEIKAAVRIAADEIRNVIAKLKDEASLK
jgi:hypothetical protein